MLAEWSSNYFYQGMVESHASVADITLLDLPEVIQCPETKISLQLIDTKGN